MTVEKIHFNMHCVRPVCRNVSSFCGSFVENMRQNAQICVSGKTLPGIKITKGVPNVVTLHNTNKIKHSNVNKLFLKVNIFGTNQMVLNSYGVRNIYHLFDFILPVRVISR